MPQKNVMIDCRVCGRPTMHIQQVPNDVAHLLVTIFTFGFWVFVWGAKHLFKPGPQCTVCGGKRGLFGSHGTGGEHQARTCPRCGRANPTSSRFCSGCGAPYVTEGTEAP